LRNVRVQPTASADPIAPDQDRDLLAFGVRADTGIRLQVLRRVAAIRDGTAMTQAIEIARTAVIDLIPAEQQEDEGDRDQGRDGHPSTEIGFAELPTCPQIRDDTVVEKEPEEMMRSLRREVSRPRAGDQPANHAMASQDSSRHTAVDASGRSSVGAQLDATGLGEAAGAISAKSGAERPDDGRQRARQGNESRRWLPRRRRCRTRTRRISPADMSRISLVVPNIGSSSRCRQLDRRIRTT